MSQLGARVPAVDPRGLVAVLRSAHPGPALAVTALTALLAVAAGLSPGRALMVVAAVLAGQLSIGWSNDLLDVRRDRAVGRTDKPLATGEVPVGRVKTACVAAVVVSLALSVTLGLAGLVQVVHVAAGWAYNLGLKASVWSWAPYAVAFGALPVCVSLAATPSTTGPWWAAAAGALLGVGAHLLNALPDLEDDAATGVRGLPHRLGARLAARTALAVLLTATVVIAVGSSLPPARALALVAAAALLGVGGLLRGGRTAFRAAVAVALLDVLVWVVLR